MKPRDPDEAVLIASAQAGDEEAWSEVVEKYSSLVWSLLVTTPFGDETRKDLCQEVFARVVRSIHRYDSGRAKFTTWITSITRNLIIDKIRKDQCGRETLVDPADLEAIAGSRSIRSSLGSDERITWLTEAIERELTEEQRLALVLLHCEGYSYSEISEMMSRTLPWVKNTLYQARLRLRKAARTEFPTQPRRRIQGT